MTLEDRIPVFRLRVRQEAHRVGNVSATCRRYEVSRTVFYRWRGRLERYGAAGLHPTRRAARRGQPPALSVVDERRILAEAPGMADPRPPVGQRPPAGAGPVGGAGDGLAGGAPPQPEPSDSTPGGT